METVEGIVHKIRFRNSENGYTVLTLVCEEFDITCVGCFPFISEGDYLKITGEFTSHPVYGEQIAMKHYETVEPTDAISMERYLASGAIKGIKEATAHKIVSKFKDRTFDVIENHPEELASIKGISEKKARDIAAQFEEKKEMREAIIFLQEYNISMTFAVKIYEFYGNSLYEKIRTNPYRLAYDINGIGFKLADEIAYRMGFAIDHEERIKAGILYVLSEATARGNIFIPKEQLVAGSMELLGCDEELTGVAIDNLAVERSLIIKELPMGLVVYPATMYYMELNCARMLKDLGISYRENIDVREYASELSKKEKLELDDAQIEAVVKSYTNGVSIITGGPGTGKTTTINTIIRLFDDCGYNVVLAAPTGRAAKRMSEATGWEAQTIHRLLEVSGNSTDDGGRVAFGRNEDNPLEADVVIIDEMSMVDIHIFHALLKAIPVGVRLVLVGDVNQLPSVGPGNVLRDIIDSEEFSVVKLEKIFRQAALSDIVVNAHKINRGENIEMDNKSKDFFVLQRMDTNVIIAVILELLTKKFPKYVDCEMNQIQVLTPMKKGELGVEKLNSIIQATVNPESIGKQQKEAHGVIFRENDKVMQIKNNYQKPWDIKSKFGTLIDTGTGVFNGDCGVIKSINDFAGEVCVLFDDGREAVYEYAQLDELELAYAITIHKSQGSEYPAVIMPLLSGPKMLMNRNLLYTGVTRAKKCVAIVGSGNMVNLMIGNESESKRYSSLALRIKEL